MKTLNSFFKGITILVFLISASIYAQDYEPLYVSVTTMHWNMDLKTSSADEWKTIETEYHEKIIMKNEYILSTTVLQHHFTEDSSEILFITVYPSWSAIELAAKRNAELEKEAWPDEAIRAAFLKSQSKFYNSKHSDEIYKTIPGAKIMEETDLPLIYYARTNFFTFPDDSSIAINDEFMDLINEYNEAVTHKNDHYKAYYPQRHFYGADHTEFVEVFVAETLAELEKGIAMQGKLFREHWKGDARQKEYNDIRTRYLTGIHSDKIFSSVPELHKSMGVPEE